MLGGRQGGWEGGGERGGLRGSRGEGGRGKKARTWQVIALSSGKIGPARSRISGSMYTGRPGGARIRTSPGVSGQQFSTAVAPQIGQEPAAYSAERQTANVPLPASESEPASGRYETAQDRRRTVLHRKSREGLGPRSVGQPVAQGTLYEPMAATAPERVQHQGQGLGAPHGEGSTTPLHSQQAATEGTSRASLQRHLCDRAPVSWSQFGPETPSLVGGTSLEGGRDPKP